MVIETAGHLWQSHIIMKPVDALARLNDEDVVRADSDF